MAVLVEHGKNIFYFCILIIVSNYFAIQPSNCRSVSYNNKPLTDDKNTKKNNGFRLNVASNISNKQIPIVSNITNNNSYTIAIFKPYWRENNASNFILSDQEDSHEGEVFLGVSSHEQMHDSLPNMQQSISTPDNSHVNEGNSNYSNHFSESFAGYDYGPNSFNIDNIVLTVDQVNTTTATNIKKKHLFSHYYIGYKLWYFILLFGVYHVIIVLYYLSTILVQHYAKFPLALREAIAAANA